MKTIAMLGLAVLLGAAGAEAKDKGRGNRSQGDQGGGQCKNLLMKANAKAVVQEAPDGATVKLTATDPSQVAQVQKLAHQMESCLNGQKPRGDDEAREGEHDGDHDRDGDHEKNEKKKKAKDNDD